MTTLITQLTPVQLSELDTIVEADDFFIFASKTLPDGSYESGRILFTDLQEAVKRLQLERRLSITMGSSVHQMFIGEQMTIYKVEGLNVGTLKVNNVSVNLDTTVNVVIPAKSLVTFTVTTQLTDPTAYLFIYAKAILP